MEDNLADTITKSNGRWRGYNKTMPDQMALHACEASSSIPAAYQVRREISRLA